MNFPSVRGGQGLSKGRQGLGERGGVAGGLEQRSWGLGRVSEGLGGSGLERAEGLGSGGGGRGAWNRGAGAWGGPLRAWGDGAWRRPRGWGPGGEGWTLRGRPDGRSFVRSFARSFARTDGRKIHPSVL